MSPALTGPAATHDAARDGVASSPAARMPGRAVVSRFRALRPSLPRNDRKSRYMAAIRTLTPRQAPGPPPLLLLRHPASSRRRAVLHPPHNLALQPHPFCDCIGGSSSGTVVWIVRLKPLAAVMEDPRWAHDLVKQSVGVVSRYGERAPHPHHPRRLQRDHELLAHGRRSPVVLNYQYGPASLKDLHRTPSSTARGRLTGTTMEGTGRRPIGPGHAHQHCRLNHLHPTTRARCV